MKKVKYTTAGVLCCYLFSSSIASEKNINSTQITPFNTGKFPVISATKSGEKDLIFKSSFEPPTSAAELVAFTSFEEAVLGAGKYFDLGDPDVAHDLVNNAGQPPIDINTATELSVDARYTPYDIPEEGLADGEFAGATEWTGDGIDAYPDGTQGYQMQDPDGNMIVEFGVVDLTNHTNNTVSIDYRIRAGGYEGDGTLNDKDSDRIKIYVKDLTNGTEIDILNTEGSNITALGIAGSWVYDSSVNVPDNVMIQLVVELRAGASAEAMVFDNIKVMGTPD